MMFHPTPIPDLNEDEWKHLPGTDLHYKCWDGLYYHHTLIVGSVAPFDLWPWTIWREGLHVNSAPQITAQGQAPTCDEAMKACEMAWWKENRGVISPTAHL